MSKNKFDHSVQVGDFSNINVFETKYDRDIILHFSHNFSDDKSVYTCIDRNGAEILRDFLNKFLEK